MKGFVPLMSLLSKKNLDARLAFFRGLDKKQIKTLYDLSTIKKLQPGDTLFKEGDIDRTLNVILNGKIKVEKINALTIKIITVFYFFRSCKKYPSISFTFFTLDCKLIS